MEDIALREEKKTRGECEHKYTPIDRVAITPPTKAKFCLCLLLLPSGQRGRGVKIGERLLIGHEGMVVETIIIFNPKQSVFKVVFVAVKRPASLSFFFGKESFLMSHLADIPIKIPQ